MGEVIGSNGGVEIGCWREIVPVVFHEARRMTVHIQFRSIKFSLSRREFHIKLSSEEDHCFLYKTAVTQDVYQRFAHYHSLDVSFEQFSEYMHHLIHSVKNNQDYGDRFFINILAPQNPTHLPHSIEFIITQGQMGCLVQCKRLSLAFTLASDAELKEHLMSCFERLKREKDMAKRRCNDLENELLNERAKVKELDERNRYFQRELEFSQTLIKSAETIQRHYESLLKQQHNYKHQQNAAPLVVHQQQQQQTTNQFQYQSMTAPHQHPAFPTNNDEKPLLTTMTSLAINPADINLLMTSSDPYSYQQQQQRNSQQQNNMINNQLLNDPDPHLDNVINFLTSNCASNNNQQNQSIVQNDHNSMIERRNTNRSQMNNNERTIRQRASPISASTSNNERQEQQHELVTPTDENPPSRQFETHMPPIMANTLTVANPMSLDFGQTPPSAISNNSTSSAHYRNSPRPNVQIMPSVTVIPIKDVSSPAAATVAVNDPTKLKGAAKRKASFHNLTNNNNSNANTAQSQGKHSENNSQSSCSLAVEPMKFMDENRKQEGTKNLLNLNNNNVLYHQTNDENNTGIIDNSASDTITTAATNIGNSSRNNELINNINPMDQCVVDALNTLLDQRNVINDYQPINQQHLHSQGHHSNHVTFMETDSFREYLSGDVNQVVTSATSMSPRLGSTNNELVDNLSNLTDSDWRNMKLEYDAFAPVPPNVPSYVAAPTPVRKSAILPPPPPLTVTHHIQMQNAAAVHSPSLKIPSPMQQQQRIATPDSASYRSAAVSTPGCSSSTSSSVAARLLQQTTTSCLTPADETSYTATTVAVRDVSDSPDARVLSMDGVLSYFKCLICDKSFEMGLAHMAQHVSNDFTTCTFCNDSSRFDSKEELMKHMISHSARVYACQYCGKENPRVHYLKIHVRSHTGEKPYTCHQCGRGFADASTWRRHERVHTGEKPYQCNICGRKIARRDNVKIHMRSHMRTKHGAACRVCGKTFTQPNHLMLHERVCMNAAGGASPSPHGSPIDAGNSAMIAAADLSVMNALLTASPSCVSPAAVMAAAAADVKINNLMRGGTPPPTSQSPMNILAAIEADKSKMAALVHHFS